MNGDAGKKEMGRDKKKKEQVAKILPRGKKLQIGMEMRLRRRKDTCQKKKEEKNPRN